MILLAKHVLVLHKIGCTFLSVKNTTDVKISMFSLYSLWKPESKFDKIYLIDYVSCLASMELSTYVMISLTAYTMKK